ncbi:hypothetical protein RN001_004622 [Aquatica leii]|uniref:DNA helicase MCM9 n=1 Tax=Aquatica leii TaxID=1421715 RepID=A0AAN7PBV5_9COLE|nr:hypothetical protein RN001_004622 [Aquatica leii]
MEEHLLSHSKEIILRILQDENIEKHFPVNINFIELFDVETKLGNKLLKDPEEALEELDCWVLHVQEMILQECSDKTNLVFKRNVHARVYGLPACPELHRTVFPRNEDLASFLQITGTVVKTRDPKMLQYQMMYRCSKCKHTQMIKANYDLRYVIIPPKKCVNREICQGKNFVSVGDLDVENCKDYQEIKIQEQTSNLNSTMPSSLWITLEDDLVDLCKPGDDVTICGIMKRRLGPLIPGKTVQNELVFKANHIQVHNGNTVPIIITSEMEDKFSMFWSKYKLSPLEGRDIILKSFCPKLYGMYLVKLAVAIVLAGGTTKCGSQSGIQKRSESHILLVGDPGTGKSQLLRYSSKIIARSVLTTGVGATSAGLTVAAIMEDGEWQLEAGALVLADGGICCIDEFNSMKPNDRTSIHEAMEQQTISVAKAGIHCKLRTRCAILAATNPKGGHLDFGQSLSLNLAIPSPLLSRFDIVLMLKDTYKDEWDSKITRHIISGKSLSATNKVDGVWPLEMLQQYFIVIKTINPLLSSNADQILAAYYQVQRQASTRNKSRTTVRLLESLIRLSQGHARLMFHNEVEVMDAIFAIIVVESSMHGECAVLSIDSLNVLASFSENPMKSYANLSSIILTKLGLNEILEFEIDFLKNKCLVDTGGRDNEDISNDCNRSQFKPINIFEFNNLEQDENVADNNSKIHEPDVLKNTSCVNISRISSEDKVNKRQTIVENTKPSTSSAVDNGNSINKTPNNNRRTENVIYKKRKKRNDQNDDVNMLNLVKSVNDDFDLNFLEDDERNPIVEDDERNPIIESQNTKIKNFHKKFKFQSKEKLQTVLKTETKNNDSMNQVTKDEATYLEESIPVLNFNDEMDMNEFDVVLSQIPDITFTAVDRKENVCNDSINHEDSSVPKEIQNRKNCKSEIRETVKTPVKEGLKSRFAFVPKNPPPNLTETGVQEENITLSMFETEDENLDFFDI